MVFFVALNASIHYSLAHKKEEDRNWWVTLCKHSHSKMVTNGYVNICQWWPLRKNWNTHTHILRMNLHIFHIMICIFFCFSARNAFDTVDLNSISFDKVVFMEMLLFKWQHQHEKHFGVFYCCCCCWFAFKEIIDRILKSTNHMLNSP